METRIANDPDTDRPNAPRASASVAAAAVLGLGAPAMAAWAWNAGVADPVAHRLFLVVWAAGGLVLAAGLLGRAARRVPRPLAGLRLLYLGLLAGTALGSTAWGPESGFWYQLWWTVPMALGVLAAAWSERKHTG